MYAECFFSKHRVEGMYIDQLVLLYTWNIAILITKLIAKACSKRNKPNFPDPYVIAWRKSVQNPSSCYAAVKHCLES